MVRRQRLPITPKQLFLAMLAIITIQASVAQTETQSFWTFFPNPPALHPVTWDGTGVPVFVNNTRILGGTSDGHITPQWAPFNYTEAAISAPLCVGPRDTTGYLKIQPVIKTAMGGANIAHLSGP